jgi:hypothetical protein
MLKKVIVLFSCLSIVICVLLLERSQAEDRLTRINRVFMSLICQDQLEENHMARIGQSLPAWETLELERMIQQYPLWFGKEFHFSDCPKEYQDVDRQR